MSLPEDLLTQARMLATIGGGRPRQANLRRAVSGAYYALFHFIGEESARLVVGSGPQDRMKRDLARRAIAHTRLKDICMEFQKATPRDLLKPYWSAMAIPGNPELRTICANLVDLQNERHLADYDFSVTVTRSRALDAHAKAPCRHGRVGKAQGKRSGRALPVCHGYPPLARVVQPLSFFSDQELAGPSGEGHPISSHFLSALLLAAGPWTAVRHHRFWG